jgi:transcriptional regulator with PAS, ATPase and Fis domain
MNAHPAPSSTHDEPELFHGMWTRSDNLKAVFRVIERVAVEDVPVLVRGETGTGKELVAAAMHALSRRREGPFRAINCAALPPALLESELFGHVKGAFTGAVKSTPGHFELAHRGTLFLDEIAELPLELQAKLLRVLETRSVLPVGAREPVPVDVRIVSATHRALRREVDAGRFRADLMYRLRVIPVFLPALRERPRDIGLLVDRIVAELNQRARDNAAGSGAPARRQVTRVTADALALLTRHDWPGNIRELRNVLTYAFIMGDGPELKVDELPPEVGQSRGTEARGAADAPPDDEAARIKWALGEHAGHLGRAAEALGLSRTTLWRRMKSLGLLA